MNSLSNCLIEYQRTHDLRKLHIGAGTLTLEGWLNTDVHPAGASNYLDATKRFPIADGTFDYVFSEHMIEHVPYCSGMTMLAECFRIARPGGKIRPDR